MKTARQYGGMHVAGVAKHETSPWFERDPKPQCFKATWSWQLTPTYATKTRKKKKKIQHER